MAAHISFACWLNYKQEIIGETAYRSKLIDKNSNSPYQFKTCLSCLHVKNTWLPVPMQISYKE